MIWFYIVGGVIVGAMVYEAVKNASFRIFIVPGTLHLAIFAGLALFDPCNNNSGCMAGSISAYFLILFTLPTIIILLISSFAQHRYLKSEPSKHSKYFKVNLFLALISFVLVAIFFMGMKVFQQ